MERDLTTKIRKLRTKLATRMIKHYLTCSPEEWACVENEHYKNWAYQTFNK